MTNELRVLEERIAELQEQNASLRESAATFAQLAERLNEQLRAELAGRDRTRRAATMQAAECPPTAVAV